MARTFILVHHSARRFIFLFHIPIQKKLAGEKVARIAASKEQALLRRRHSEEKKAQAERRSVKIRTRPLYTVGTWHIPPGLMYFLLLTQERTHRVDGVVVVSRTAHVDVYLIIVLAHSLSNSTLVYLAPSPHTTRDRYPI